jgi:hypothetical protein
MRIFVTLTLLLIALSTFAQGRRYRFIGIQPGAQVDLTSPYYPPEVIDFNVIPIVFQTPINTVTDFKINSIASYRFEDEMRISRAGLQVVFPRFFTAKQRFSEKSSGWYLGPLIGGSRDFYRNHYAVSPGLELGRYSAADGAFAWSFSLQGGCDYRLNLNRSNAFVPFVGIQLGLGLWMKDAVAIRGGSI